VEDLEDLCLGEPGPRSLNGCPDTDLDGIADREDRCPDTKGSTLTQGCPDYDKDGLADLDDQCPKLFGPKGRLGCPILDTDADGVLTDEPMVCQPDTETEQLIQLQEEYTPLFKWLEKLRLPVKKAVPETQIRPAILPIQASGVFNF
jgi:hypothetical protein